MNIPICSLSQLQVAACTPEPELSGRHQDLTSVLPPGRRCQALDPILPPFPRLAGAPDVSPVHERLFSGNEENEGSSVHYVAGAAEDRPGNRRKKRDFGRPEVALNRNFQSIKTSLPGFPTQAQPGRSQGVEMGCLERPRSRRQPSGDPARVWSGRVARNRGRLFVAERFDGIHQGGAAGRVKTEQNADRDRDAERQHDRRAGYKGLLIRNEVNDDLGDRDA